MARGLLEECGYIKGKGHGARKSKGKYRQQTPNHVLGHMCARIHFWLSGNFQIFTRASRPTGMFVVLNGHVGNASNPHKLFNLILYHPKSFPFLADGLRFNRSVNQIGKVQRFL